LPHLIAAVGSRSLAMAVPSRSRAAGDRAVAPITLRNSSALGKGNATPLSGKTTTKGNPGAGSGGFVPGSSTMGPDLLKEIAGARDGTGLTLPDIEGPLEMRSGSLMGKWQRQWCRIADGKLTAYDMEDVTDEGIQNQVVLERVTSLSWQDGSREFALEIHGKNIRWRAKTQQEAHVWFTHLKGVDKPEEEIPEEQQIVEGTADVFLQVHTIFGLPLGARDQTYRYFVRAAWQDNDVFTCSEDRPGVANGTPFEEDCRILQQLLLARVSGHHLVNLSVCRRKFRDLPECFEVLGKCKLSTRLSQHRSVHQIMMVDEEGNPTGISVKTKLKVLVDSNDCTSRRSEASQLATQVRSDSNLSPMINWLLTGIPSELPGIEQREGKQDEVAVQDIETNTVEKRDHGDGRAETIGYSASREDLETKNSVDKNFGARSNTSLVHVRELYQRHADRLAKLELEQKKVVEGELKRLEGEVNANRVGTRAKIESIRPMEAAARLYHDAKAGEFRKLMLEQKARQEEDEELENRRVRRRAEQPSSALERAKRSDQAIARTHELHALHKVMLARHELMKCVRDQDDTSRSASPARVASPHRWVELHNEGAERQARRRSLSRRREEQVLLDISRRCPCGNLVGDDKDARCMYCATKPLKTPERSRSTNLSEVAQKLHGDHTKRQVKRQNQLERLEAREKEEIKARCSCGQSFGKRRCPACFAKNPAEEPKDGPPDAKEVLDHTERLYKQSAKREKTRLQKVKLSLERERQRTENTCVCGFDYSSFEGDLTCCPQCHSKRFMPSCDPKPDGWVSDRMLALVLTTVSARCGCKPNDTARGLRDLGQQLKDAIHAYRHAARHSATKSPGYSQLCKLVSMRVYCDGTLMKDPDGAHQCCEPDPIRQLYEDLDTLMVTAAKAQDLLLMRVGPKTGSVRPEEMSKRWPAGSQWKEPAVANTALFAYNPGTKSKEAAHRKALVLYGPSEGPRRHRHLMDLARLDLVFADCESLQRGLEQVCSEFEVLDVRNKYHPAILPNMLGERFVEVLIVIKAPQHGVTVPFVCELRLEELCYFEARAAARPHLEKVCHGFRAVYKLAAGKDLDAIEYAAHWALHRPQESQLRRLFQRHLAQRFGSSVAAFRTLLGDGILIPFVRFREACQLLGKRDRTVEFWLELDPGRGGCLSIFELDPKAAAFLSKAYTTLSHVVDRDAAALDKLFERLSDCHRNEETGLHSADTFRDAVKPIGFSHEDANTVFSYLDMHRPNKWSTPQLGATSSFITCNDFRWLLRLPERLYVELVALSSCRRSSSVDISGRRAFGQQNRGSVPQASVILDEGHRRQSPKALTMLKNRRLIAEELTADGVLKNGDASIDLQTVSRDISPELGQELFAEVWRDTPFTGSLEFTKLTSPGSESMHLRSLSEDKLADILQVRAGMGHPLGAYEAVADMGFDSASDDVSTPSEPLHAF